MERHESPGAGGVHGLAWHEGRRGGCCARTTHPPCRSTPPVQQARELEQQCSIRCPHLSLHPPLHLSLHLPSLHPWMQAAELEQQIIDARAATLDNPLPTAFFALFRWGQLPLLLLQLPGPVCCCCCNALPTAFTALFSSENNWRRRRCCCCCQCCCRPGAAPSIAAGGVQCCAATPQCHACGVRPPADSCPPTHPVPST